MIECRESGKLLQIGKIVQLQVQQSSLKLNGTDGRYYDPGPILSVPTLELEPSGVVGRLADGYRVIDVHHQDYPKSKNRDLNGISIGFVTHYEFMRQRVGDHLSNGLAGENILIETSDSFTMSDLPSRLWIEAADGQQIELVDVQVAEPCVEFTKFCLQYRSDQKPDAQVTETLEFLRRGMRGYYATYLGAPATVRLGDCLVVPPVCS
jgi:hypothetical protein